MYGFAGALSGKFADSVMVVRNGVQLVRKYQPVVSNPKSPGQVAARAKLKLMSQLSEVMAPVIALQKVGGMSSRNLFVKKNYLLSSYANNMADVTLAAIQLTDSVIPLATFTATRQAGQSSIVDLAFPAALPGVNRVIYAAFVKVSGDKLRYAGSTQVTAETSATFAGSINVYSGAEAIIYAYGVRLNSERARVAFGNITTAPAESTAKLIVSSSMSAEDITLTETVGVTVPVASNQSMAREEDKKKRGN